MNTNHQDKHKTESDNAKAVSNIQNNVFIQIDENEDATNKNTVVNIEQGDNTGNVIKSGRNKYWVMFFGTQSERKGPPAQETGWFPWHYIPGCGPPPLLPRPPPLNYKPETRNSFVKLVLCIVLIMIIATAAFVGFVLMTPDVKDFFYYSRWNILLPALGLLMIVDYGMMCSPCTRQPPCNVLFLFLAVVGMSLISAKVTAHYKTEIVLYAIIATSAVIFVCILLACSGFDFTRWLLYVIVIGTVITVVLIIIIVVKMATGTMMKPIIIGILIVSSVLQSIMLTIQLQMILGGKSVELSESDYALGAFMVYTSIIDIFLKMVQIIGLSGN